MGPRSRVVDSSLTQRRAPRTVLRVPVGWGVRLA